MIETITITVVVILSVAFFTLAERNIIAVNHTRNGPNNAFLQGTLQPMADAVNLVTNEWNKLNISNNLIHVLSPTIGLGTYIILWIITPNSSSITKVSLGSLLLIAILGTSIIFAMTTGWASNSKYSIIGSYRSTAQAISYEVSIAIFILTAMTLSNKLDTININEVSLITKMLILPIITSWIITVLAETSRTPFDFTESESELVSGFNTEYYGSLFSVFFIAEYLALIFMATLSTIIFFESNSTKILIASTLILAFITMLRMTLPRSRYDNLISLAWLTIMPIAILSLVTVLIL